MRHDAKEKHRASGQGFVDPKLPIPDFPRVFVATEQTQLASFRMSN